MSQVNDRCLIYHQETDLDINTPWVHSIFPIEKILTERVSRLIWENKQHEGSVLLDDSISGTFD